MLTKKIIKNLKAGNYRVAYREHCECRFYWSEENDKLVCDTVKTDGDCWIENVLIMDDLAGRRSDTLIVDKEGIIASYDAYYGLTVQIICLNDVKQEIIKLILDSDALQKLQSYIKSPNANNHLHYQRKYEALIDWFKFNN